MRFSDYSSFKAESLNKDEFGAPRNRNGQVLALCHGLFRGSKPRAFHFEDAAADMKIALGKRNLDSCLTELLFDCKIKIAAVAAGPSAHLTTPDHQLKIDRVVAEFPEKNARRRIL